MNLFILPKAMQRLDEIYDYIFSFSEIAASGIYNEILDELNKLELFPYIGSVEPVLADCGKIFRSLVIMSNYKVIYYVEEDENAVYVATVWDCRQNPEKFREEVK